MARDHFIVIFCVVIMTIGQILFKQVAVSYNRTESFYSWGVLGVLAIAGFMYITSTGLWIWALRTVEISKAYPYFALGFVFVPLVGAFVFNESISLKYLLGVALIFSGVILTSSS